MAKPMHSSGPLSALRQGIDAISCGCNPINGAKEACAGTTLTSAPVNSAYPVMQAKADGTTDNEEEDAGSDEDEFVDTTRRSWQEIWGDSGDHPLVAALRLHTAHSEIFQEELRKFASGLQDLHNLSDADVGQVHRLLTNHVGLLGPSSVAANDDWLVHERIDGCEYGARLAEDMFQWFRIVDLPGSDIVKGFAAFLEVDLARAFAEDLICAEPLGVHTSKKDAAWRTIAITTPSSSKEDNIWIYSSMNALAEPLGALVIFAFTPSKLRLTGVWCPPDPESGFVRSEFDCAIHYFEPLWIQGVPSPFGFRLTQMGVSRPSAAIWSDVSAAVATQCIKDGTGDSKSFKKKFESYIDHSFLLQNRMRASPRTDLYDRIRKCCNKLWRTSAVSV